MKEFGEHLLCLKCENKPGVFSMVPCLLTRLTMEDREEALALHRTMAQKSNPALFVPGSGDDFLYILDGGGIVLGIRDGKRIVCMRSVLFKNQDGEVQPEDFGLLPDQWKRMAFMDYCIVRQEFRGNSLQFLTYRYMESLLWDDFDYIYTTVSPHNIFSLRNVLHCGFHAFQLKECYGGYMRYKLLKDMKHSFTIRTKRHVSALVSDYPAQQAIFSEGLVGYRLVRHHAGLLMSFGAVVR